MSRVPWDYCGIPLLRRASWKRWDMFHRRMQCALTMGALTLLLSRASLAGPIVIVSHERGVLATASWLCCPRWPPGAECRVDSATEAASALGVEEFWRTARARLACAIDDRRDLLHGAVAGHRSTLDSLKFTGIEDIDAYDTYPAHARSRFQVSFLVLAPCRFRLSGTSTMTCYALPNVIRSEVTLVGEETQVEFRAECGGIEQHFERTGVLSPGSYEFLALLEVGPIGGGEGILSFQLEFSETTSVQPHTWSAIKRLYE